MNIRKSNDWCLKKRNSYISHKEWAGGGGGGEVKAFSSEGGGGEAPFRDHFNKPLKLRPFHIFVWLERDQKNASIAKKFQLVKNIMIIS